MTLEEEIKRCEEVAEEREQAAREWHDCCGFPPIGDTQEEEDKCRESARECKQLAEWLKELKAHREREQKAIRNRCPMV